MVSKTMHHIRYLQFLHLFSYLCCTILGQVWIIVRIHVNDSWFCVCLYVWFQKWLCLFLCTCLYIQGVPKKRGISECLSVCFTADLISNLAYSFLIQLKIEIHMFVPSTELFLRDIREPSHRFFKYPIFHQTRLITMRSKLNYVEIVLL